MLIWGVVSPFLPDSARTVVAPIIQKVDDNKDKIDALEQQLEAWIASRKTVPVTPPVAPITPVTPTIAPLTPAEIQAEIQKGIQDALDKWKQVQPINPTPVIVQPVVPVIPVALPPKINLTDANEKPLVGNTVDAGVLFQVSTDVPSGSAGWTISRHGNVSVVTLKGNAGFACSLNADPSHRSEPAWVEFFLTNFDTRVTASARIDCNQAPMPPPTPPVVVNPVDPPKPVQPIVAPVPSVVRLFWVYDASKESDPSNAIIRNNSIWWSTFASGGNTYRIMLVGSKDAEGTKVLQYGASKGLSAPFMIVATPDGTPIKGVPCPKTVDEILPAIRG